MLSHRLVKMTRSILRYIENVTLTHTHIHTSPIGKKITGLLNESHPRVFQTIVLYFLIAF